VTKSFLIFMFVLLLAAVFFGVYIHTLTDCKSMANSPAGFTLVDCHKLYLAFGVLFGASMLLLVAAGLYALVPPPTGATDSPGKAIFDGFLKALIPIITLVLGYYFGSASSSSKAQGPTEAQVTEEMKQK
jgi:hypothetical protein